ncbi:MAG: ribonuclease J [Metamycoplasmataceae bacterium]
MQPTKFFGLGGMQEIGKSTLVVEHNDKIFIIDSGIKFGNGSTTGIKGIIPNYKYLKENEKKIKGLFLTHGHEDHMGGIPYLLQQINLEFIYAPKIAIKYLEAKISERKISTNVKFIEIEKDEEFVFDDVVVDFWTAQHSIPDAFGIRISTPNGSLMFTGDFRFDYTPIGNFTDFTKLEQMGKENLSVLFSDSTNAMRPFHSPSEKDILKDIRNYMEKAEKKIIITAFASNMTRISAIIEIAAELGKKVVSFGRSMVNGVNIGREIGYINVDPNVFIDKKNISKYDENEIVILTTGSQGEQLAALAKMSIGKHPQVHIKNGDLIIFSSSPIPGNRMKIELLINSLYKLGADIKENRIDGYLHTSGHAYREEHDKIFQLTKPDYFVPYHGEYRMSVVHGQTAVDNGVKPENVFIAAQGEVYELINRKLTLSDERIDASPIYIDGDIASEKTSKIIKERELLGKSGFIHVVVTINRSKNEIIGRTKIISRGTLYVKTSLPIITESKRLVHGAILYKIKNHEGWTTQQLKKLIQERLQPYFYKVKRRKPIITSTIFYTDDLKLITPKEHDEEIVAD